MATLTLKSSYEELFKIIDSVAFKYQYIKDIVEDIGTANPIPLLKVSSKMLSKVLEYCKYHVQAENPLDENTALTDNGIRNSLKSIRPLCSTFLR